MMHQDLDTERNRLSWQCRRGMRELDEILGLYLDTAYAGLGESEKACFSRLLEYPDSLLLEVLMGRMIPTDTDVAHLVHNIRSTVTP
jgi:antitoxin CptB